MCYINKSVLKQTYEVFGSFYNLCYGTKVIPCRNLLEIKRIGNNSETVDAVIVMMNPGSSEPNPPKYIPTVCSANIQSQGLNTTGLVLTTPDETQFQIMRIMHYKKWNFVKVINLSDIREPNSNKFCSIVSRLRAIDSNNSHSIFSTIRQHELEAILKTEKIIVAWGVNTKLSYLIRLALSSNKLSTRVGHSKDRYKNFEDFYYYHPLPRGIKAKKNWLKCILAKV